MVDKGCRYTKKHEWARKDGDLFTLGISDFAQQELGDIVYVELPSPGKTVEAGDAVCSIESVKAVSDVYAPISGTITEVNQNLENSPELINSQPYTEGWICRIESSAPEMIEKLLSPEEYEKFLEEESE